MLELEDMKKEPNNISNDKFNRLVKHLFKYFSKFRGRKRLVPLEGPPPLDMFVSGLGSFIGIGLVAVLAVVYEMPMIVASFGASAVLVYGVPDAPLSQPRNVIFGHLLSAIIGVIAYAWFGLTWWSAALATTFAILIMLIVKVTHPPGGATALFAVLGRVNPSYVLTPVLSGAVILVVVAILVNNLSPNRIYPRYWW